MSKSSFPKKTGLIKVFCLRKKFSLKCKKKKNVHVPKMQHNTLKRFFRFLSLCSFVLLSFCLIGLIGGLISGLIGLIGGLISLIGGLIGLIGCLIILISGLIGLIGGTNRSNR